MVRLTMMIISQKVTQKLRTRRRLSVHYMSFLWTYCQELVRSTTPLFVAVTATGLPFWEISAPSRQLLVRGPQEPL
jgi:hypothetical protein